MKVAAKLEDIKPLYVEPSLTESLAITNQVQERLRQILVSESTLQEILYYIQQTHGKMIRPTLVALVFELCQGTDCELLVDVACAIELIHIASLIHDDVVDDSERRRSAMTVPKRFGAASAVLAGDFLLTKAFDLLLQRNLNEILTLMTKVIQRMCEGEIHQLLAPGVTEAYYWQYIYKKTACFIEAACQTGAIIAGQKDTETLNLVGEFGCAIGYAYQLIDDLLDYSWDHQGTGKRPGMDFEKGIWTLPIIRGVAKNIITPNWQQTLDFHNARQILHAKGVIDEIKTEAKTQIQKAQVLLEQFPPVAARYRLWELAEYIGTRSC